MPVENMKSVMVFKPQDTEKERYEKFTEWHDRHAPERAERAHEHEFLGPHVPGPKETRKMLSQYQ